MANKVVIKTRRVGEPVVVSISHYNGETRLDIRHYYTDDYGELKPTKKGISVPINMNSELIDAVQEVVNDVEPPTS